MFSFHSVPQEGCGRTGHFIGCWHRSSSFRTFLSRVVAAVLEEWWLCIPSFSYSTRLLAQSHRKTLLTPALNLDAPVTPTTRSLFPMDGTFCTKCRVARRAELVGPRTRGQSYAPASVQLSKSTGAKWDGGHADSLSQATLHWK